MLDLSNFLTEVRTFGQKTPIFNRLATMFENVQDAINQTASGAGLDSTQHLDPPEAPTALFVSAGSDHVHVTLTDNSKHSRMLHYFVEWTQNDKSFLQPYVEHLGISRQRVLALPANDQDNNPINYYFRAYSGLPGSSTSSPKQTWGGTANPIPVQLTGTSKLRLLPSTGAGTASTTGQQGGEGFGTAQYSTPKQLAG
jgi:hypothetical protein